MTSFGGCMSSCKLFETLSKSNCELDNEHNPTSYDCKETCPWYNKCFYSYECPPQNARLQEFFGGWQKYARYEITDKKCHLKSIDCPVINVLHLINPNKIDDIVIYRVAKKNKTKKNYNIRYYCVQGNKMKLCSDITELNNFIDKRCNYVGRKITLEDFKNV